MIIKNLDRIIENSALDLKDDYAQLWMITDIIHDNNPEMTFDEILTTTKIVVKELCEKYHVQLVDTKTCKPSNVDCETILHMIEKEYRHDLSAILDPGRGFWLTID